MALDTNLNVDVISIDTAGEIDAAWINAGMPHDGLRIVGYRIAGNRSRTYLAIPGNDSAPCYEYFFHRQDTGEYAPAYYHVSGPTLAEWQVQREYAEASQEAAELYEWASGR